MLVMTSKFQEFEWKRNTFDVIQRVFEKNREASIFFFFSFFLDNERVSVFEVVCGVVSHWDKCG